MTSTCPNPFPDISTMLAVLRLPQSRFEHGWRLTEVVNGHINGLSRFNGRIVATDGMMCVLVQPSSDGSWTHYLGHWASFIPEENNNVTMQRSQGRKAKADDGWLSGLTAD